MNGQLAGYARILTEQDLTTLRNGPHAQVLVMIPSMWLTV